MRLTVDEQASIKSVIESADPQSEIYLYGSRVKDELKGGDIDLLVLSKTLTFSSKIDLLVSLKRELGDRKIDLTIKDRAEVENSAFVTEILKSAVRL